jgi:phytanoyl-CoA hydroxylase
MPEHLPRKELSPDQMDFFRENGYLCIENFASPAQCDRLRTRAAEIVAENASQLEKGVFSSVEQEKMSDEWFLNSGDKIRLFMEEEAGESAGHRVNKIGHALHDLDPDFEEFSLQPRLAGIVADLGFKNPLLMQSMFIFKQPGIGGEVTPHQDATFLYTDPLSVTGFWFALEDAAVENACLWALPGGHKTSLKKRFHRDGKGGVTFTTLEQSELPDTGYVPLEVAKGSLIILDGLLPHKSSANRSERTREAYTLHIVEGEANYPGDNWLQRTAEFPARGFS